MKIDFFISHPVMTIVLSLVLVLGGGISILVLPIAKYPPVLPPTVEVKALYPGASAEVIEDTVTTWLEDAINGVPGMVYMTSRSNDDGSSTITVTFELGYDIDSGELDILNRVTQVTPRLPAEVRRMGISVRKVSQNLVLSIMLYDDENRYSTNFLSNYAQIYMLDEMARVPGVGAVGFRGQRIYAMRIWLDPDQLATRQLTASDVVAAIEDQNLTLPLGATGLPPTGAGVRWQRSVNATGRLQSAEAFSQIVVKPGPANSVVRLSDVADIELGSNSYSTQSLFEGHKSVAIIFKPVPGANLVQMAKALMGKRAAMACTVAVEEVIGEHYGDQLDQLGDDEPELRQTVAEFRADELGHRDTGLEHAAKEMPGYTPFTTAIKAGTRLAIWLSERI